MLLYIIDGWNVVHKVAEIKDSARPRQDLISFIKRHKLTGSRTNKVTVVFDGFFGLDEISAEHEFKLMFSGDKQADTVIIEELERQKNPAQVIVVSNDREVAQAARQRGARTVKVEEFTAGKPARRKERDSQDKYIGYADQRKITEEMRKIWIDNKDK